MKSKADDDYIHLHSVEIYTSDCMSQPFITDLWRGKISSADRSRKARSVKTKYQNLSGIRAELYHKTRN
jgi:hypothetical protein